MQRLNNERGAVAVMVALLMVPLIGFAAIAVDVAALRAERQQLQTGADAGAPRHRAGLRPQRLRDAGRDRAEPRGRSTSTMARPTPSVSPVTPASHTVTVTASSQRTHAFAQVLGFDDGLRRRQGDRRLGHSRRWDRRAPADLLVVRVRSCRPAAACPRARPSGRSCSPRQRPPAAPGPSNNFVPGGFGWLDVNSGCNLTTIIGQTLHSSTGASLPSGCSTADSGGAAEQDRAATDLRSGLRTGQPAPPTGSTATRPSSSPATTFPPTAGTTRVAPARAGTASRATSPSSSTSPRLRHQRDRT